MKELAKLKWYCFDQNNSGGYFTPPARFVWVQGFNPGDIQARFDSLGVSTEYCPCCGERWTRARDLSELTDTPEHFGRPLDQLTEPPSNVTRESKVPFGLLVFYNGTQKILHTE